MVCQTMQCEIWVRCCSDCNGKTRRDGYNVAYAALSSKGEAKMDVDDAALGDGGSVTVDQIKTASSTKRNRHPKLGSLLIREVKPGRL